MVDILFKGVGWTDIALTLNRVAVGMFFMFSGYHKLFNAQRHRMLANELKALHIIAVRINQWWVPLVEFAASGAVLHRAPCAARRAWPACDHTGRRRHGGTTATQSLQADR